MTKFVEVAEGVFRDSGMVVVRASYGEQMRWRKEAKQ